MGQVDVAGGLCACGCGEGLRVVESRSDGWSPRFVRGHQRRGQLSMVDPNPSGLCLCGCGAAVPFARPRNRAQRSRVHVRFLPGHAARKSPVDYVEQDCGFETLCWVWQRKITRKGYGILTVPRVGGVQRGQHAHRWMYEKLVGALSAEFELHHRCEVRLCVNPAHMEPLTDDEHKARHAA